MKKSSTMVLIGLLIGLLIVGGWGMLDGSMTVYGDNEGQGNNGDGNGDDGNGNGPDNDNDDGADQSGDDKAEEKTKAQWKFSSSQCTVAIDVHKNRNLKNQTLVSGNYLTWSDYYDRSQLTVVTESNCYSGYEVSVYASNTQPGSVDVLSDFGIKASTGPSNADPSNISLTLDQWSSFSDTGSNNSLLLGKVNERDVSGSMNGGTIDGTEWIMDYRYEMDNDDIPNTEYFVELMYVVSSQ